MSNGARVQLRGDTVGGSVWSVATTRVWREPPRISHGKPLADDDGLYCVVAAVFAPTRPDPSSNTPSSLQGEIGGASSRWVEHRSDKRTDLATAPREPPSLHTEVLVSSVA